MYSNRIFFNLAELKLSFFGWIRAASKTLIQLQLHKLNTVLKREFVWIEIYLLKCLNKKSLHSYNTNSNLMIFSASSRGRKNRDPKPLRRLLTAIKKHKKCSVFRLSTPDSNMCSLCTAHCTYTVRWIMRNYLMFPCCYHYFWLMNNLK